MAWEPGAPRLEAVRRKARPMHGAFGRLVGAAVVAVALGTTSAALAQTKTLKMQSTWPASLTLQDNFKFFGERVEKLTGGTLKIEALAAGQIVPPFEVIDDSYKKVID
jgi:TRAP-type mannitol/chloroaromatic compound transport system substrate-binding protein